MKNHYETTDGTTYHLLQQIAKENRNNPTEAEKRLWCYLSSNRMGVHFRQQHPIAGYIPDFVCLSRKLIIEIDGGYHFEGEQPELDAHRTAVLEKEGYRVIRFNNEEVITDIDSVLERITAALEEPSRTSNGSSAQNHINLSSPWEGSGVGRIGFGFDVHRLVPNRDLWLGGIKIEHSLGLLGHSDADVLIHAIADALLGAANMRDIGYHFPDTSAETEGMDSKIILKEVMRMLREAGYELGNIDATICAERPKINPHVPAIKACLAQVMEVDESQISIKATTTERLGFTGREEGIAAYATVLIGNFA